MNLVRNPGDSIRIEKTWARAYEISTDRPESDGTLEWKKTTLVTFHVRAGGQEGFGYTYAHKAAAQLAQTTLAEVIEGKDPMDVPRLFAEMVARIRNYGRPGIAQMAIAAVDAALWDVKAKLLGVPLARLFGMARGRVPVYGSGGFTSYTPEQLSEQLGAWAREGISRVKMKVGRDPGIDYARVQVAHAAIGPDVELFVDGNGAYSRKEALKMAERFAELDVHWFEEPVSSDDLEGLRLVRDRAPAGMDIAAGEYGFDAIYFRRMLEAGAVDVLQADASRCAITGYLEAATLADAHCLPLSGHCAPALHVHPSCSIRRFRHLEYFHDHVRIESMLFDGLPKLEAGALGPDLSRPGMGIELKEKDAERFAV